MKNYFMFYSVEGSPVQEVTFSNQIDAALHEVPNLDIANAPFPQTHVFVVRDENLTIEDLKNALQCKIPNAHFALFSMENPESYVFVE